MHSPSIMTIMRRLSVLAIATTLEILSCIPSTESFATSALFHGLPTRRRRLSNNAIRTYTKSMALSGEDDSHTQNHDRYGDEPSCILKERNPYDVHVYYKTAAERETAIELRQKMHSAFGEWMRFYAPKDRPIGPHPVPMWEADFGGYEHRHKWTAVRNFLLEENTHNLSILIHPHSLDGDYADHTEHAFWAGEVLPLRIGSWRR